MNLWKKLFRIEPKELSPAELERRKSKLELARRSLVEFIGSGDLREVKELVNDNRDVVLTRDEDGLTPLHRATVRGDKDIVKFLLAKGADKNATDKKGKTPLHHAVWWQKKEMVRFLVDNGAEVDARDEYGTPLHLAIGMRNHNAGVRSFQTIVELLQRRGAIGPDNVRFQNMGAIKPRRLGAPVMGFKCFIGGHTWSRCKCSACGKTRDEEHDWSGCKCSACGKTRDSSHQWGPTLGPCMRCGAIHEAQPFINVIADPTGLDPTKTKTERHAIRRSASESDRVVEKRVILSAVKGGGHARCH
jgi:hypothetical protein